MNDDQKLSKSRVLPNSRGPSFKGGHSKDSHHGHEDVVKVEVTVVPDPLLHHGQRSVFALLWAGLCLICASIKFPLKELHSDTSKHELQQRGDGHDVADGPDGHKHALDHV